MPPPPDQTIDCSGLECPLPLLKAKKAMDGLLVGQVLLLIATDPAAPIDLLEWTERTGHALLATEKDGKQFRFYLRKAR